MPARTLPRAAHRRRFPRMCGRYTLTDPADLEELAELGETLAWTPRYNVAPTQSVPVLRSREGRLELALLRWGLVPSWAKDLRIGNRMANARAETVMDKPAFRAAFRRRRCLVPATGFYEWRALGEGRRSPKQPYFIRPKSRRAMCFAGLWEHWQGPAGEAVESFTIITTEANGTVRPIHERMPVIIAARDYRRWLDPQDHDVEGLAELLVPAPDDMLELYPVSTFVSSPRHEGEECIARVESVDHSSPST